MRLRRSPPANVDVFSANDASSWLSHSALYAVGPLACLSTIKNAQEHRKRRFERRPAVEKHTISDSLNVLWGLGIDMAG